jgi:Flp pilus assembly protein TadD
MRFSAIMLTLLLCACASQDIRSMGSGQPGLNVARAALAGGSPDLALRVADDILAKEPRDVPALLIQGDALVVLGRMEEARTSYTKALALDLGSVWAKIGLGRLRLRSDPTEAQSLFLSVLQREPRNVTALNNLGIAYDLQGEHLSAQSAYRRALSINPAMRAAEVNLALSMALSGRATEAVQLLRPLAADPNAAQPLRHDLAAVLAMAGDKQAAAQILSADLTPEQIERALVAYGALGL